MKNWKRIFILGIAALLTLSLFAAAQMRDRQRPRERMGISGDERPGDIQETLQIFFVDAMRKHLNLTDEQTLKILPIVRTFEEQRRAFHRERKDLMEQLSALADRQDASEEELAKGIQKLRAQDDAFRSAERKTQDEIFKALSPRQRLQFIIFTEKFRQKVGEKLREFQERRFRERGSMREGGGPDATFPDAPEDLPENIKIPPGTGK